MGGRRLHCLWMYIDSKMKKCLFLFCLLLLPFCAVGQKIDQDAAKKEIVQAAARMKSMQCDFVQTKHLSMLSDQMVSRGTLSYQQSDKLRWQYTSPYSYTFVINGSEVLIRKGERSDRIDVNQSKVFKEIARIMMNSVLGRNLTDERDFKTTITSSADGWTARMVPQRKEMKRMFQTILLNYNRKKATVTRVELIETNGDRTVIELKNIRTNETLPKNIFAVD